MARAGLSGIAFAVIGLAVLGGMVAIAFLTVDRERYSPKDVPKGATVNPWQAGSDYFKKKKGEAED